MTAVAADVSAVLVSPSDGRDLRASLERIGSGSRRPGSVLVATYRTGSTRGVPSDTGPVPPGITFLSPLPTRSAAMRAGAQAARDRSEWLWLFDADVTPDGSALD